VVSDLNKLLNQHDFEENKCQQVKLVGTTVHSIILIFYLLADGHMIGCNMYKDIVYIFTTLMCIVLVLLLYIQSLCMVLSPESEGWAFMFINNTFMHR